MLFKTGDEGAKLPVAVFGGPAPTISLMSLSESALAGFYRYNEGCLHLCASAIPLQAVEVHGDFKLAPPRRKVLALTFPAGFMTGKPRPRR